MNLVDIPESAAVPVQGKIWVQNPEAEAVGFLGLITGHFDIAQKADTVGEVYGSITTAINSGIAVVTPADAVRELLMREDVVGDREQVIKDAVEARAKGTQYLTPPDRRVL